MRLVFAILRIIKKEVSMTKIAKAEKKPNPPVSVQIIYALGFLGLIFGLLTAVLIFVGSSSAGNSELFFGSGLSGAFQAVAVVYAAIVIAGFYVVVKLRAGRLWALITYSVLYGLALLSVVSERLSQSELERYLNGNNNLEVLITMLILPLVIMMWTKDRAYFN